jgi:LysM repeat protein
MGLNGNPKSVAALLIGGTLLLLGGGVVAASLPAPDRMVRVAGLAGSHHPVGSSVVGSPVTETSSASSANAASPVVTPQAVPPSGSSADTRVAQTTPGSHPPVTYVVKPGNTLSGLAGWFKLHGYGDLYAANAAVIGPDPNLIRPGERITISGGVMTVRPSA